MKPTPISRYMSAAPVTVQQSTSLLAAIALLEKHGVRHLPVLDGHTLVGIVSERDLAMAGSLVPLAWREISVAEAMTPDPYCVPPETPLARVAEVMAERHLGAALIVGPGEELLGLFTTTDALSALATYERVQRATQELTEGGAEPQRSK